MVTAEIDLLERRAAAREADNGTSSANA